MSDDTPNKNSPDNDGWRSCLVDFDGVQIGWRRDPESNRATRICNPLHNRFAIAPRFILCRLEFFVRREKKGSQSLPFSKLERDKRLELSTYTLARYRSTN